MAVAVPAEMVSMPLVLARSASRCSPTEVDPGLDLTSRWTLVCFPTALLAEVSTELVVAVPLPAASAVADSKPMVVSTTAEAPTRRAERVSTESRIRRAYSPALAKGDRPRGAATTS